MRVVGLRRDPALRQGAADAVHRMARSTALLPEADFVALTCPLTPETENLIDAAALGRMKPSAYLVNVARGRVVDEAALVETLAAQRIAGAALDVTVEEPLPPNSPLWGMEHVLVTPHTAGETRRYEDNVIEILRDNLDRCGAVNRNCVTRWYDPAPRPAGRASLIATPKGGQNHRGEGMMKTPGRLFTATALTALAIGCAAYAEQPGMSFFVTSAGSGKGADLGGLAGADRHCQQLGAAAGAGSRTWHAYLSTQAADGSRPSTRATASARGRGTTPRASSSRRTSTSCTAATTSPSRPR